MMNGPFWGMGCGMWIAPIVIFLLFFFLQKNNVLFKNDENPLDILKKRYAKGEITLAQFDEMKKNIL